MYPCGVGDERKEGVKASGNYFPQMKTSLQLATDGQYGECCLLKFYMTAVKNHSGSPLPFPTPWRHPRRERNEWVGRCRAEELAENSWELSF